MDRSRSEHFERWDCQDLEDERVRLRTVPIEERLRETVAWSATLLADELERSAGVILAPDPIGLGQHRA